MRRLADASNGKIEIITVTSERKQVLEPEIMPAASESEKAVESLFNALASVSSLDGPGVIIGSADDMKIPENQTGSAIRIPLNYSISIHDRLGEGGAKAKFRDNIEALKVLKRLRSSGASFASPDDQKILVKYVGWGGLPQAFDPDNAAWRGEAEELRRLVTPEEYAQIRRSTQDAHYTSPEVMEGIYNGLRRLGVDGPGMILEPSAGIGHFIGLMPDALRAGSDITAVELDGISAAIGQYLYPGVNFVNKAFQESNAPENAFDLIVGNPPFGNQKIYDADRPDLDYSIHNYFLAKSVESLRDGGIAAFVVSRYFMDAENNPARELIASKANLLGAVRLPNTAFKRNALTEVTTDIVFFQKTREPELDPAWLKIGQVFDEDENGQKTPIRINQYFVDNPGQMAGRMKLTQNMYRGSADLVPEPTFSNFPYEIHQRLEVLPENIYKPSNLLQAESVEAKLQKDARDLEICAKVKTGAFFQTHDGRLAVRQADVLGQVRYDLYEPKNKMAGERIAGMIKVRDSLSSLMELEKFAPIGDSGLELRRASLNRTYDAFVKKYGFINSPGNRQAMRDDPEYPLLSSLERDYDPGISKDSAQKTGAEPKAPSADKADIFSKRVLGPKPEITHVETAKEALIVSMNAKGRPDLDYMEGLCGKSRDEVTRELAGLIFLNPENETWELADHYLTGNVKSKLTAAKTALEKDSRYRVNVEALEAVQPLDLEPVDIAVQLGSTWVPGPVVADFAKSLLGPDSVNGIGYHPAMGGWAADFRKSAIDITVATSTWGTERYPAPELIEAILNNTPIRVMDKVDEKDGKPVYQLNDQETAAACQKADEIKQAFKDWIWEDQERRESLARLYNDRFNTHIPRKYNGSHLELPGSSMAINLRPHQKDAIWRGIQDGTALFDHVVGAGKTMVVVGTIMESRRMGLMKKPMVVVPNHLLTQWQDAFYSLYPGANILVADKTDFKMANRKKLFAKVATGDWDAVVVAHSSFAKIGLPEKTLQDTLNEQVNDLTKAIEEMKRDKGEAFMIKQMEKTRERLKSMMERKAGTGKKDDAVSFADLGVDALFVDESQEFKNLYITTKMRNVAGLGNLAGSNKAFDLFVKARYLQEKNNGRGLFFATGTPISNTIAEMYTVQRYLQYDELKAKGLAHFDSWASTFGEVKTGWELDATGVGYKLNSRFSSFQNMPELINMYRTVGDVITQSDLIANNQGVSFTPKIKGGKPRNIVVERSPLQEDYMGIQSQVLDAKGLPRLYSDGTPLMEWNKGSIIHRMEHLPKDPKIDNPLKITNDARKAGLDFRLINEEAEDFEGSKVHAAADEITRIWNDWKTDKGTQLVFCDLSTPKLTSKNRQAAPGLADEEVPDDENSVSMDEILACGANFSVYDDLKQKLINRGIPANEIKFIHEANTDLQKAKLFEQVNRGQVRVLIGSTAKMGAGTNVQKRLVAEHHLDAPWRPSDLEQREGRIIRQGNELHARDPENFEVEIIRYATKQTYDARMWQTIENKAQGIEQFRKGDNLARVIEDIAGEAANAAEMKAAATGNELIFLQVQLASDLRKLEGVYASFQRGQHQLESRIARLEEAPAYADREISRWKCEIEHRNKHSTKEKFFAAGGKIYGDKQHEALLSEVSRLMKKAVETNNPQKVGQYRGCDIHVEGSYSSGCRFMVEGCAGIYTPENLRYQPGGGSFSIGGFLQRLDNYMAKYESFIEEAEQTKQHQAEELANALKSRGQAFPQQELLEALRQDNREVIQELRLTQKDPGYKSDWKPKSRELGQTKKHEQQQLKDKSMML